MTRPRLREMTLEQFGAALAAKQPVPGGGAAAACVLAHSAALGAMVIAYTRGKPKFAAHEDRLARLEALLTTARSEALDLGDRDADAYQALNALWKLPADERSSRASWHAAVAEAIAAPAATTDLAVSVLAALTSMREITSVQLASDLKIAQRFAHAAVESALANVEVNLPQLCDEAMRASWQSFVMTRRAEGTRLAQSVAMAL